MKICNALFFFGVVRDTLENVNPFGYTVEEELLAIL